MAPAPPPYVRDHFEWARKNQRQALGRDASLSHAICYVSGFNAATDYALLRGFQEWLVVRLGFGFEYHWTGLADRLATDLARSSIEAAEPEPGAVDIIDCFFVSVIEFLSEVEDRAARRTLFRQFEELRSEAGLP